MAKCAAQLLYGPVLVSYENNTSLKLEVHSFFASTNQDTVCVDQRGALKARVETVGGVGRGVVVTAKVTQAKNLEFVFVQ